MDLSFARKRRRRSAAAVQRTMPPDFALLMAELSASATASPTGLAQASLSRDGPKEEDKETPQVAIFGRIGADVSIAGSFHTGVADLLTHSKDK